MTPERFAYLSDVHRNCSGTTCAAVEWIEGLAAANERADQAEQRAAALLPVIEWIREHHRPFTDSDVLDIDHGPIVEWTVCDWCQDHIGDEDSDWPCKFIRAIDPLAASGGAAPAVQAGGE